MSEMESMIPTYVLECTQLLEHLEELLLGGERNATLSKEQIDEVFRIMHTIKGSSAMMEFDEIATLAHGVEDLFSKIREERPPETSWERIFDVVLSANDFFKDEIDKVQNGETPDGSAADMVAELKDIRAKMWDTAQAQESEGENVETKDNGEQAEQLMAQLEAHDGEHPYWVKITFDEGCQMETIRAYGVFMAIKDMYSSIVTLPADLEDNHDAEIIANGFWMAFSTTDDCLEMIKQKIEESMFVASIEYGEGAMADTAAEETLIEEVEAPAPVQSIDLPVQAAVAEKKEKPKDEKVEKQNFINVNVKKIDKLMNLVGEIVTTESMVTKNAEVEALHLESFEKQARQLRKLTDELQDIVMSIRMVPIAATFHRMQRIVRDICKKTNKSAELVIIGEDTEVDKNIIDNLSDPLMHLIRNAVDHGIETPQERMAAGKSGNGTITLEANSTSGDIVVRVMDDGSGMDRDKIIRIAYEKGLTTKPENEISDKEAFGFTLLPGFSTNDEVTEYSGRGVGMDVVRKNIEKIGGSITVESEFGKGTVITMHIPLTLAILDGMKITVGDSTYIVPTLSIRESLEPRLHQIITEPNQNEMIIIRGVCYPILRLNRIFGIQDAKEDFNDGIMVLVDCEAGTACLFADELLGEQQAVVKPMPMYVTKTIGRIKGISGCTIMGDGGIALILDINNLLA